MNRHYKRPYAKRTSLGSKNPCENPTAIASGCNDDCLNILLGPLRVIPVARRYHEQENSERYKDSSNQEIAALLTQKICPQFEDTDIALESDLVLMADRIRTARPTAANTFESSPLTSDYAADLHLKLTHKFQPGCDQQSLFQEAVFRVLMYAVDRFSMRFRVIKKAAQITERIVITLFIDGPDWSDDFHWDLVSWGKIACLARQNGWEYNIERMKAREALCKEKNIRVGISKDAASSLAQILEQLIESLPDSDILAQTQAMTGASGRIIDPCGLDISQWFCGPEMKDYIRRFVRYLRLQDLEE